MIIFSVPKKSESHIDIIQTNAVESWKRLTPKAQIILLKETDIACNSYGTPTLDSIFSSALSQYPDDCYAYVNTDIILTQSFVHTVDLVKKMFNQFLIIGRRYNISLSKELIFADGWDRSLASEGKISANLAGAGWIDYFVFSRGVFDQKIPPFALGRTFWDKWLVWSTLQKGIPVIDATHAITAYHQAHSYNHVNGGAQTVWRGEEARENIRLAGGWSHGASISDAQYSISNGRIKKQSAFLLSLRRWRDQLKMLANTPWLFDVSLWVRSIMNRRHWS